MFFKVIFHESLSYYYTHIPLNVTIFRQKKQLTFTLFNETKLKSLGFVFGSVEKVHEQNIH